MTGPAFLQGTQDTTKPNVPKKKFQGKARKTVSRMNHSGIIEEELTGADSVASIKGSRKVIARLRKKDPGGDVDLSSRDPKNSPDETDSDNEGRAIHELLVDTRAGDRKGALDRYNAFQRSQVGKKKFAGKPKDKPQEKK